jgi:hypothetical protein
MRTMGLAWYASVLLWGVCFATQVHAEGTETLGPVVGSVASGSEIVTAGVGLVGRASGVMHVHVPAQAVVKQVFLYWQGRGTKDSTAVLNDKWPVTGKLIGASDNFKNTQAFAYRVDITHLNLVRPGDNTVKISGVKFGFRTDGASLVVIVDDGTGVVAMDIRDGADFAYHGIQGLGRDTVKQVFTFAPSGGVREGRITLLAGDGEVNRPDELELYVGSQKTVMRDALRASEGNQWDVVPLSFLIPAGTTSVSVQLFSRITNNMTTNPESLTWVMAAFELGCGGRIGDQVWLDANRDGVMDVSESGLEGAQLTLANAAGHVLSSQRTNASGRYMFEGLCPGSYQVSVDAASVPVGLLPTYCAGQTLLTGATTCGVQAVSLNSSTSEILTVDFGYALPPPPPPPPPPSVLDCFTVDEVSVSHYWNQWGWNAVGFNMSGMYALAGVDTMLLDPALMQARMVLNNGAVLDAPLGGWKDLGNRWVRYDYSNTEGTVSWHWLVHVDTGSWSVSYWGNGPNFMNTVGDLHADLSVMGQAGTSESVALYELVASGHESWSYERPLVERCPGTCE